MAKNGWNEPTLIQQSALPLALQGKDILVQARTGTGKTACYVLPVLQSCLMGEGTKSGHVRAVVLVPTKELARQVKVNFEELAHYCGDQIRVVELSASVETVKEQRALLRDRPAIVVATPARIAARLADRSLNVSKCNALVVDEADLVLGYGYAGDVSAIIKSMPSSRQTFLMSATLGDEVRRLQKEALNRPALLTLQDDEGEAQGENNGENGGDAKLRQLSVRSPSVDDKYLMCFVMFKLRLIQGKTLVFVNNIGVGFKLQLFLKAFYIKAAVLNSELPENSRNYIVEEFDKGSYDVLIASDEGSLFKTDAAAAAAAALEDKSAQTGRKREREAERREYGVARGVDFQNVSNVINFDFPTTPEAYVHRIGRTARAGAHGKAVSFVCTNSEQMVLEEAVRLQSNDAVIVTPFTFKLGSVEGFRYRVEDILGNITRAQVKEARVSQIKAEVMRSQKLKEHFQEHPQDLEALTAPTHTNKRRAARSELRKIPDYLRPSASDSNSIKRALGGVKTKKGRARVTKAKGKFKKQSRKGNDPLKSLRMAGPGGGPGKN